MVSGKGMKKYLIDIFRMRNQLHQFEYEIDEVFFESFDQDLVNNGKLNAKIDLLKSDSFISMAIDLQGTVKLVCDRSLEEFNHKIEESNKVIFKYGEEEREIDHDVVMITHDTQQIDVGQYIFEFVSLAIPMKKLHPKYRESDEHTGSWVFSSERNEDRETDQADPRWEQLKKLKKN